jgi:Flp pilus assembly pilin Flp
VPATRQMEGHMRKLIGILRGDERGIETLEWLAVAVLILIVAFALYPGTLQGGLQTVITNITTALQSSVPSGS